jgi:hypothetical protein
VLLLFTGVGAARPLLLLGATAPAVAGGTPRAVGPQSQTPSPPAKMWLLPGQTVDAYDNPLPFCSVACFVTGANLCVGTTSSDSNGNFLFAFPTYVAGTTYFLVAYLRGSGGSPDLEGTTVNTLVPQ